MRDEGIVREWFGAIRAASDRALGALAEKRSLDDNQKRKADLLLRQLLSDRIPALAAEAEGFADLRTETLRANVYSELIEDALAGTGAGPEDMAVAVFLSACSEGSVLHERPWSEGICGRLHAAYAGRDGAAAVPLAQLQRLRGGDGCADDGGGAFLPAARPGWLTMRKGCVTIGLRRATGAGRHCRLRLLRSHGGIAGSNPARCYSVRLEVRTPPSKIPHSILSVPFHIG